MKSSSNSALPTVRILQHNYAWQIITQTKSETTFSFKVQVSGTTMLKISTNAKYHPPN